MNKKILVFSVIGVFAMMLVSAAIINYSVSRDVVVTEAYTFSGNEVRDEASAGGEESLSEEMNVESETSVNVPLIIITIPTDNSEITHTINYLLDNSEGTCANYPEEGWREECEKRIDFDGMTLSDFNSMSWDVNVIEGYISHVDLILDNGESLTIEYATFDSDCNAPATYPTGEYAFVIDGNTYAWTTIPGPCGDAAFEEQHNTLTEWKETYPTATITRIEIEVDNWIEASNSEISNIVVNGVDVSDKPFLLPSGEFNFNVGTEFDVGIVGGTYTIGTSVTTR